MKFLFLASLLMFSMNVVAYNDSINRQNIIEVVSSKPEIEEKSEIQSEIIKHQIRTQLPRISEKRVQKIQKRIEKKLSKKIEAADEGTTSQNNSVAGFVLGLLSLIFAFVPFIGLALGITGLLLSINEKKKSSRKGLAQAGFIMSIIGTAIGGIIALFYLGYLLTFLFASF